MSSLNSYKEMGCLDIDMTTKLHVEPNHTSDEYYCNENDSTMQLMIKQEQTSEKLPETTICENPICDVFAIIKKEVNKAEIDVCDENVIKYDHEIFLGESNFKLSEKGVESSCLSPLKPSCAEFVKIKEEVSEEKELDNEYLRDEDQINFVDVNNDMIEEEESLLQVSSSSSTSQFEELKLINKTVEDFVGNKIRVTQNKVACAQRGSTVDKLFKCNLCKFQTNIKINYNKHIFNHTKIYKCLECGFEFTRKSNLKSHYLTHSTTKLYKCADCEFECHQKAYLKIHSLTHSNTKVFKCNECEYECNHKGSLRIHLLSHSNLKLFKCTECGYECNRKCNLKRHLLTHSNMKFFKCPECDYSCNQKSHLKSHLLTHSDFKLFNCHQCHYRCNQKSHLKRHLLTHSTTVKVLL